MFASLWSFYKYFIPSWDTAKKLLCFGWPSLSTFKIVLKTIIWFILTFAAFFLFLWLLTFVARQWSYLKDFVAVLVQLKDSMIAVFQAMLDFLVSIKELCAKIVKEFISEVMPAGVAAPVMRHLISEARSQT